MVAAYTAPLIGPNVKPAQLTNGRALVISSRTATAMPIGLVGTYRIIQAASGAATTPPASIDTNTKPSTPARPSDPINVKADADATATSAVFTEPIAKRGRTARFRRKGVTTGPHAPTRPFVTPPRSAAIITPRGLRLADSTGADSADCPLLRGAV